jgi:hypothetical protein
VEIGEDMVEKIAEFGRAMGVTVNTDVLVADQPDNAIVERAGRRAELIVMASARRPVSQGPSSATASTTWSATRRAPSRW